MKRSYYIFSSGTLLRRQNTLFFYPSNEKAEEPNPKLDEEILSEPGVEGKLDGKNKKVIPIDDIDSLFLFGEINFNTRFLDFLAKNNISAHTFNYYGFYNGSFYPREYLNSGKVLVAQVQHYRSKSRRLLLAQKLIEGAAFNIARNLKYYNAREADLQTQIDTIESLSFQISKTKAIDELMGIEGNIRQIYYSSWPAILKEKYDFKQRVKHPPDNAINALISFANSMVYTTCLSEIYRTQLSPLVSFLHQPGERRFSLALDLAEIFKPIMADRVLFKCLNTARIGSNDFDKNLNYCYLNPNGRKAFVKEYEERLTTTFKHRTLKRHISYRRLIRLECYKLVKHILGSQNYEPFKAWW